MVSNIIVFSPLPGEDEPILTHIFQMGWFNPPTREFSKGIFPQKIINDMFPQIHLHQFCLNKLHNLTSTTAPAMLGIPTTGRHQCAADGRDIQPTPLGSTCVGVALSGGGSCKFVGFVRKCLPFFFANKNNCLEISSALFFKAIVAGFRGKVA